MSTAPTTQRPTRQAFGPNDVLAAAGLRVHDFVIKVINEALCEGMQTKSIYGASIRINKEALEAQLAAEAEKLGVQLNDANWWNFPYVFSGKWDVKLPPASSAGFFGKDLDCYIFTPKGVSSYDD